MNQLMSRYESDFFYHTPFFSWRHCPFLICLNLDGLFCQDIDQFTSFYKLLQFVNGEKDSESSSMNQLKLKKMAS